MTKETAKSLKQSLGVMIGPHDNVPVDQTHTYLHSQFLHCTNGWRARWRALSQFAFVPHNLFSSVCPLCCVYVSLCVQRARARVVVCFGGFMALTVPSSLWNELFRHTVAYSKAPLVR